jgi:hypothetical protein
VRRRHARRLSVPADELDTWLIYIDVGKYKKDNDGNDDQTR